ncbi:ATP-binding protein [Streptosporangium canum]|uniref:ATP-binding protein n=1 Tax=Streptosporangium canum TaxID=324952 RepID=UPI0037993CD3
MRPIYSHPEHTTAVSLLDRLPHHSTVVAIEGESFRMRRQAGYDHPGPAESLHISKGRECGRRSAFGTSSGNTE